MAAFFIHSKAAKESRRPHPKALPWPWAGRDGRSDAKGLSALPTQETTNSHDRQGNVLLYRICKAWHVVQTGNCPKKAHTLTALFARSSFFQLVSSALTNMDKYDSIL